MGVYEVTVKVSVTDVEEQRLTNALRAEGELGDALSGLAAAATDEWLDQVLARRLPSRMKDARELRLLLYALRANSGQLPSTDQIADLFHLTAPEAKTLHRNTRTRYSFELAEGLNAALTSAIKQADWVPVSEDINGYLRVHLDDAVFEHAELLLRWGNTASAPRLSADANYGDYRVPLAAMRALCDRVGLDYDTVFKTAQARQAKPKGAKG